VSEDRTEERSRRPRIADVAREAGVSKTAVSFAFNNPDRLNPETATRILDVADRLGYRPHPVARMLTQGETMTIGVLTPQALAVVFSNPFFGTFSQGMARVAEERGYGLHFVSPVQGSLAMAASRAIVDGFVAVGLRADHPEVTEIRRAGLPIVGVDANPFPDQSSVEVDDEGGARLAAEHLLALGHREVCVLAVGVGAEPLPADPAGVMGRRLLGYRAAFAAAGLRLPDSSVVAGEASIEGGIASMASIWATGRAPTAVLAMSDAAAVGALLFARERGLRVPGDLSVIGFDDVDLARSTDPPLTTVHQPILRKGEEAVRLLLAAIEDPDGTPPEHTVLDTHLEIRGSTGPVRTGLPESG
jgi:DNA-binding LacI/PurR family transcriptional regulator